MSFQLPGDNTPAASGKPKSWLTLTRIVFAIIGLVIFLIALASIAFAWVPSVPMESLSAGFTQEQLLDKGRYLVAILGLLITGIALRRPRWVRESANNY